MKNFLFLFTISIFFTACDNDLCLSGEGQIVNQMLDLESIHTIILDIPADITLKESATQRVEISAQQNIIDEILQHSIVSQGVWKIRVNRNCILAEDIRFFVDLPEIKMLSIDGSGNINGNGIFENTNFLDLDIDGSGTIDIDLSHTTKILAIIDGSGKIDLDSGTTDELLIDIDGSGDVEAFGMTAKDANVSIDGSGDVEVSVEQRLDVSIDGSGDLCYIGDPTLTSSIRGSGSVNNCN